MNPNLKAGADTFANYLQWVVRLETLQKMTEDLDEELADSQRVMTEIKAMYESIPKAQNNSAEQPNNGVQRENIPNYNILEANIPKILMPDMVENAGVINLEDCIAKMKSYTEGLKNTFLTQPQPRDPCKPIENLDIEQYATSLDQLGKRLANIKINKRNEGNNRSVELEAKLTQLSNDVNMFTQMVQAKTSISQVNDKWAPSQQETNALYYDNIINKLLSGINEVIYLLQNKN